MRLDIDLYRKAVSSLAGPQRLTAKGCSLEFSEWMTQAKLPVELSTMLADCGSESELWAGSGSLFGEKGIICWNDDFPEALSSKLLIVGSAPNGDHTSIDLKSGDVGYISHENDWRRNPREFFISISPSIGRFIQDINASDSRLAEDYWEALNG